MHLRLLSTRCPGCGPWPTAPRSTPSCSAGPARRAHVAHDRRPHARGPRGRRGRRGGEGARQGVWASASRRRRPGGRGGGRGGGAAAGRWRRRRGRRRRRRIRRLLLRGSCWPTPSCSSTALRGAWPGRRAPEARHPVARGVAARRPGAAWRRAARGGLAGGLQFTLTDELGGETTLRAPSDRPAWLWLASLSRLPTSGTAPANLLHAGAGWAVAEMLWARPLRARARPAARTAARAALRMAALVRLRARRAAGSWAGGAGRAWPSCASPRCGSTPTPRCARCRPARPRHRRRGGRALLSPPRRAARQQRRRRPAARAARHAARPAAAAERRRVHAAHARLALHGGRAGRHLQLAHAVPARPRVPARVPQLARRAAPVGRPPSGARHGAAHSARVRARGGAPASGCSLGGVVGALLLRALGHRDAGALTVLRAAAALLGWLEAAAAAGARGLRAAWRRQLCDGAGVLYAAPHGPGVFELLGTTLLANAWRVAQFAALPPHPPPADDPCPRAAPAVARAAVVRRLRGERVRVVLGGSSRGAWRARGCARRCSSSSSPCPGSAHPNPNLTL